MDRDNGCVWTGGAQGHGRHGRGAGLRHVLWACVLVLGTGVAAPVARADDASVLPPGVWRAGVTTDYYLPIEQRYDPDGHTEDLATDYNTTLDNSVFPALPAGAVLGTTMVSFEYTFRIVELKLYRGVTPRLSLGVKVPYWWVKNTVKTGLDQSTANFGKVPVAPYLAPVSLGGTPLTADEVQDLIGPGLDANSDGTVDIPGFGFDRVKTWSRDGFSDIELGGRYQYLKTDAWRLAFTGGVRLPTGKVDDPDSLVDYGFGSGAYALLFHFNNDLLALAPVFLDVTLMYEVILPDRIALRVPADVNNPVTNNKESVNRDIGDVHGIEVAAKYAVSKALSGYVQYRYKAKAKNDISGTPGTDYSSLEKESDSTEQIYFVGIGYSTLPRYARTHSGVPMIIAVEYRNRFAGTNNSLKSDYVSVTASVFY